MWNSSSGVLRLIFSLVLMFLSAGPSFVLLLLALEGRGAGIGGLAVCAGVFFLGYRMLPAKGHPIWPRVSPQVEKLLGYGMLGVCCLPVAIGVFLHVPSESAKSIGEMTGAARTILGVFSFGMMGCYASILFSVQRVERGGRSASRC